MTTSERRRTPGGAHWFAWFSAVLALVLTSAGVSQVEPASLQLDLDAYRIDVVPMGDVLVEERSLALEVAPGDVLEWWLRATHGGAEALSGLALDLPIPSGTFFVADSVALWRLSDEGELDASDLPTFALLVSADGGASFHAEPLLRRVSVVRDGVEVEVEEPVDPASYTHVRVVLDVLPADTTLVAVARTVVR